MLGELAQELEVFRPADEAGNGKALDRDVAEERTERIHDRLEAGDAAGIGRQEIEVGIDQSGLQFHRRGQQVGLIRGGQFLAHPAGLAEAAAVGAAGGQGQGFFGLLRRERDEGAVIVPQPIVQRVLPEVNRNRQVRSGGTDRGQAVTVVFVAVAGRHIGAGQIPGQGAQEVHFRNVRAAAVQATLQELPEPRNAIAEADGIHETARAGTGGVAVQERHGAGAMAAEDDQRVLVIRHPPGIVQLQSGVVQGGWKVQRLLLDGETDRHDVELGRRAFGPRGQPQRHAILAHERRIFFRREERQVGVDSRHGLCHGEQHPVGDGRRHVVVGRQAADQDAEPGRRKAGGIGPAGLAAVQPQAAAGQHGAPGGNPFGRG